MTIFLCRFVVLYLHYLTFILNKNVCKCTTQFADPYFSSYRAIPSKGFVAWHRVHSTAKHIANWKLVCWLASSLSGSELTINSNSLVNSASKSFRLYSASDAESRIIPSKLNIVIMRFVVKRRHRALKLTHASVQAVAQVVPVLQVFWTWYGDACDCLAQSVLDHQWIS